MSVRSALLSFFALLMRILPQTTPTTEDSDCLMASFITERHVGLQFALTTRLRKSSRCMFWSAMLGLRTNLLDEKIDLSSQPLHLGSRRCAQKNRRRKLYKEPTCPKRETAPFSRAHAKNNVSRLGHVGKGSQHHGSSG